MPEPRPPRRLDRRALTRRKAKGSAVPCVSRLDAVRWHIRLPHQPCGLGKEIYLSPDDDGLLYVTTTDAAMHLALYGDMGDDCVRNLGDCLVTALSENMRHVDIRLDASVHLPAAAAQILESFGRSLAQTGTAMKVAIHGPDQAARMLTTAFAQGAARTPKNGGPA